MKNALHILDFVDSPRGDLWIDSSTDIYHTRRARANLLSPLDLNFVSRAEFLLSSLFSLQVSSSGQNTAECFPSGDGEEVISPVHGSFHHKLSCLIVREICILEVREMGLGQPSNTNPDRHAIQSAMRRLNKSD